MEPTDDRRGALAAGRQEFKMSSVGPGGLHDTPLPFLLRIHRAGTPDVPRELLTIISSCTPTGKPDLDCVATSRNSGNVACSSS